MSKSLAALALSILLSSLGISIANVALPTLAHAFGASFQQVQWVVLAYLLATTTLLVVAGRLGDRIGRRRLLIGGIVQFTIATALCAVAPTLWLLIAARVAQGAGAAIMTALAMALAGEAVPKEKTGSAMGLLGTTSAIGTALGPTLGGLLIDGFGWRAIFFISVPPALVALLLVWRSLPADVPAGEKAASPLIQLAMFRDRALSAAVAMSALVTTVVMTTLVVGPFYLSGTLALDTAAVGLVMSCGPIVAALTGVPAGRLVDRFGAQRMTVAGLAAMALGSFTMTISPPSLGVAGYVAPLVIITAGYALFQAANNTAVMTGVLPDRRGVVSGMLNFSRNLGLIAGASLMGAVFNVAGGMRPTFAVATVLIGFALAFSTARTTLTPKSTAILMQPLPAPPSPPRR